MVLFSRANSSAIARRADPTALTDEAALVGAVHVSAQAFFVEEVAMAELAAARVSGRARGEQAMGNRIPANALVGVTEGERLGEEDRYHASNEEEAASVGAVLHGDMFMVLWS